MLVKPAKFFFARFQCVVQINHNGRLACFFALVNQNSNKYSTFVFESSFFLFSITFCNLLWMCCFPNKNTIQMGAKNISPD